MVEKESERGWRETEERRRVVVADANDATVGVELRPNSAQRQQQ